MTSQRWISEQLLQQTQLASLFWSQILSSSSIIITNKSCTVSNSAFSYSKVILSFVSRIQETLFLLELFHIGFAWALQTQSFSMHVPNLSCFSSATVCKADVSKTGTLMVICVFWSLKLIDMILKIQFFMWGADLLNKQSLYLQAEYMFKRESC